VAEAQASDDVRLMLAFREGDASAFDELFRRWARPVLRYLARMVRDEAAAEDLAQEVFLRVHRARERYAPDARFSTWLFTIATRLALNELRRPARRSPHQSTHPDPDGPPVEFAAETPGADAVAEARRGARVLEAALAELPERQRAALWLTAVEGHSYAEVAMQLETTEQSVKALVHRARVALAERIPGGA
jgi:RNA polymerase sigma-70 factor (ECF subfamily)